MSRLPSRQPCSLWCLLRRSSRDAVAPSLWLWPSSHLIPAESCPTCRTDCFVIPETHSCSRSQVNKPTPISISFPQCVMQGKGADIKYLILIFICIWENMQCSSRARSFLLTEGIGWVRIVLSLFQCLFYRWECNIRQYQAISGSDILTWYLLCGRLCQNRRSKPLLWILPCWENGWQYSMRHFCVAFSLSSL